MKRLFVGENTNFLVFDGKSGRKLFKETAQEATATASKCAPTKLLMTA
ncbi:hypothetical protein [Alloprevotella sp. OH1205_COT-284]|nr:hypothetical protein [Alloprevotella sp. OH1205_COT-284]